MCNPICENTFCNQHITDIENQNKMLKTFLDNTEAGMYVTDYHTGEILYANRKMVALGGGQFSIELLIGQTCWSLLNSEGNERCSCCPYKQLIDDNNVPTEPYVWEHYFQKYQFWLKIISQAILWVDGRLVQMNTFFDITENKQMQFQIAELARVNEHQKLQKDLQTILDKLPVPVRITDQESSEIMYVNDEAAKLFGCDSPHDIIGRSAIDFISPVQSDGKDSGVKLNNLLHVKESFTQDIEYLTLNGKIIDARATFCVINYKNKKSTMGIITDLTAEKERQQLLLSAAAKEREANQLKSNFLSNMSHEIRTPMNAIIGLTEIELNKRVPRESLEVYRKINVSAKNLLEIVNDVLDLSKIEANKIDIFPVEFELEGVLDSALLVVSPHLEGKPVELLLDVSLDLPRYLFGDRTRLWQILKNCLDNAAKYTSKGNIILTVTEDKAQSSGNTIFLSFSVKDTGIGMDEQQIQRVFLPYEQFYNNTQKRYTGTGLGMSISKQLCDLMDGVMEIESTITQGTTIRFTIPFARVQNNHSQMCDMTSLDGLKILAVDDNAMFLEIIKRMLKNNGANYTLARSGEEALRIIREQQQEKRTPFDVILLDYIMDDMNGLETIMQINREPRMTSKLLLVTAYEYQLDKSALESMGIAGVVEKPFSPSTFIEKIRMAAGLDSDRSDKFFHEFIQFTNVRVLICEDNDINQEVAMGMLEQFGVESVLANNGLHGLDLLEKNEKIDLILMDLHMPVMDGFEATRIIRSNLKYNHIPIISLTADAMTEIIDQCLEIGMDDYLAKPFDMGAIHKKLLKWLPENKRLS